MNRRTLADNIDAIDAKIAELQREKAEFYGAYREDYEKRADKDEVKLELAAVKAAIRQRQRITKDKDAVVEKDDRIDQILIEITGTPVATRTRAAREASPDSARGLSGSLPSGESEPVVTQNYPRAEATIVSVAPRLNSVHVEEPEMPSFLRRTREPA